MKRGRKKGVIASKTGLKARKLHLFGQFSSPWKKMNPKDKAIRNMWFCRNPLKFKVIPLLPNHHLFVIVQDYRYIIYLSSISLGNWWITKKNHYRFLGAFCVGNWFCDVFHVLSFPLKGESKEDTIAGNAPTGPTAGNTQTGQPIGNAHFLLIDPSNNESGQVLGRTLTVDHEVMNKLMIWHYAVTLHL